MPQIRPITDLRNTNEISELCHAKKEPIFIIEITEPGVLPYGLLRLPGLDHGISRVFSV